MTRINYIALFQESPLRTEKTLSLVELIRGGGLGGQIIAVFPEYDLVIGAHSDVYGQVNLEGFEDISQHSYTLNYKIIDEIAPLFADYASQDMTSLKPNVFDFFEARLLAFGLGE